jgi:predicted nucleic-acid-binding protein
MIGLDTNVLLRMVVGDDVKQQRAALAFLRRNCSEANPAYVNRVVAIEFVWVMEGYERYSRAEIADVVENLLHTSDLRFEDHDVIRSAAHDYRNGIDFPNAVISRANEAAGCSATATFDKIAVKRLDQCRLIP